ncbi:MAG: hypothetical protein ACR2PI_20770 [Hyphomicrobiaceae bacterium]
MSNTNQRIKRAAITGCLNMGIVRGFFVGMLLMVPTPSSPPRSELWPDWYPILNIKTHFLMTFGLLAVICPGFGLQEIWRALPQSTNDNTQAPIDDEIDPHFEHGTIIIPRKVPDQPIDM